MSCSSSLDGFFFKKDRHKCSYRYELIDDEDSDDQNEVIDREEWSNLVMYVVNREQLSGEDLRFALSLANGHPPPLTGRSLMKPSRSTSRGTMTRTPRPPVTRSHALRRSEGQREKKRECDLSKVCDFVLRLVEGL
ncbi:hypothetical protein LWI29_022298 [Acer saccharum]|uniref:Uncharacterized protein n=1 Tax=Acer saccharum TaxID=4024 RepID=A0AA39W4I9_ACESA|nr:hypothetical protein LWI29_022298 [Acer saccharum]